MKVIQLTAFGDTHHLSAAEFPIPQLRPGEVLVQLKAISINPIDVKTRAGKGISALIKDRLPVILGWDFSGTITAVAPDIKTFHPGDEVFAFISFPEPGQTYAEYVAAPADQIALKPANISHHQAAAATLAAMTAWQALTRYAQIQAGDRVLIHAAAGGVGHYALQMAKHLGAHVTCTSSKENETLLRHLGADEHVDYKAQAFETAIAPVDYILDTIGGDYIDRSIKVLKPGGTIVSIPSGLNETVTEKAATIGAQGYTMKAQPNGKDMNTIANFLDKGIVHSHVSKIFAFSEMAQAHDHLESGHTVGKITLTI